MKTIADVLRSLLATLPKCKECDKPATRFFMTVRIPLPEEYAFPIKRGVTFLPEQYTGASYAAQFFVPKTYRWQWDCCDDHEMPLLDEHGHTFREIVHDHAMAETIRDAQAVLVARSE